MKYSDRQDAELHNVKLLSLYTNKISSPTELYTLLNNDPASVFEPKRYGIEYVTHIIGHAPITAEAAMRMRKLFPESKVRYIYI